MPGNTVTSECDTNMSEFALLPPCAALPSTHLDIIDATVMENDCLDSDDDLPELLPCEFADIMFADIEKNDATEHANDVRPSMYDDLDTMSSIVEGADVYSDGEVIFNYFAAFVVPRGEGALQWRVHLPEEQASSRSFNKRGAVLDTGSEWSWIPRTELDQAGIDFDSVALPIPSEVKETLPVKASHYVRLRVKINDSRASA